jgi:glycosyltransferase involved in cell wall biosynthesis
VTNVSVIVPVYNRDNDLRRALTSVQRQSYADFECLIIDDASTIDIAGIVAELADERFRYIRRDANGGPAAARKTGLAEVTLEYVLTLDSDCELYPWAFEQKVRHFQECPEADIVSALPEVHWA